LFKKSFITHLSKQTTNKQHRSSPQEIPSNFLPLPYTSSIKSLYLISSSFFLCNVICVITIENTISTAAPLSTRTIDSNIELIDQYSDIRIIIYSNNKEKQQVFYRSIININTTNKRQLAIQ
jgi:hypothetical protein